MRPSLIGLGILVALVMLVHGAAAAEIGPARYVLPPGDKALGLYLRSDAGRATLATQAATADAQIRVGDELAGPGITLRRMQDGTSKASLTFELTEGLPADEFFNLSKPVVGSVHVRTTGTTQAKRDGFTVRVTLLNEGRIVGGNEFHYALGLSALSPATEWNRLNLRFWPEAFSIRAGTPLSVRLDFVGGFTDLYVGTGGAHASDFELRTLSFDPFRRLAALNDERQIQWGSPTDLQQLAAALDESPASQGAGLPALLLLLGAFGRGRAALAVLLAVALAAAGCLGGAQRNDVPTRDDPSASDDRPVQRTEVRPDLQAAGHGAVEGIVRDPLGLPVAQAFVGVQGTSLFTLSDASGRFAFPNVTRGTYTVRIDAHGFASLEQPGVQVEVGQAVILEVTLRRSSVGGMHAHDGEWEGAHRKVVFDADVTFRSNVLDVHSTDLYCFSLYSSCGGALPTDLNKKVPPGATSLHVYLNWTEADMDARELGLRIANPYRGGGTTEASRINGTYLPRASGTLFHVVFLPSEADPAHQMTTDWRFQVFTPAGASAFQPTGKPVTRLAKVHVSIVAVWGVVAYEPAHKDFWLGKSELPIFRETPGSMAAGCVAFPTESAGWAPPKLIPPGTAELRVKVQWDGPSATAWSLAYRTAHDAGKNVHRTPSGATREATSFSFVLRPTAEEVDQYYQRVSQWRFLLDDHEDAVANSNPVCHPLGNEVLLRNFRLTVTAHRDPDYEFSPV